VEFSLEDMDMSRFQQGATYEQIQDWVQEKYYKLGEKVGKAWSEGKVFME